VTSPTTPSCRVGSTPRQSTSANHLALDAAFPLFDAQVIRAVGVGRIIAESGVAGSVGSLKCQPASALPVRLRNVIRRRATARPGVSK
jgi:hypothetical protein